MSCVLTEVTADFDETTDVRLDSIVFDAKTLRVIAEAAGNVKVAVSTLEF